MTPTLDQLTREILHYEDQARTNTESAIKFKIEIGNRLQSAKDLLPHGQFLPWAKERFQWSSRHCQKHMQLARNAPLVSHLPQDVGLKIALQAISPKKEPKPARPVDRTRMDLEDVIQALETAPRIGSQKDKPEGSRYIQISETLVKQMLAGLRRELRRLPKAA